jgi:hypothetical protein
MVLYLMNDTLSNPAQWVQVVGLATFSTSLAILDSRKQYCYSVLGVGLLVIGSGLEVWHSLQIHAIYGVAISYFLLPLTILVVQLKLWRQVFPKA